MVQSILLENSEKSHEKYIKKVISSGSKLYILVAFLKNSGLDLIYRDLKKCIKNNESVTILIGLDMYVTDPDALLKLYDLCKKNKKSRLYIYKSNVGVFHPKIYASKGSDSYKIIIGSSNLTSGGLINNIEASLYISTKKKDTYLDIKKMFRQLSNSDSCKESTLLNLHQYKNDYEIYASRINDANEAASNEIENSFILDLDNLQEYLDEYLDIKEENESWLSRKNDYIKAKRLLNEMLEANFQNNDEFIEYYGLLVGAAGKGQLWHSGSINRLKNWVAQDYELFMLMLSELKENIGSSPLEMFSIAEPYVNEIKGLGYNVVTEILNTYAPEKYPILNNNPLNSIKHLGFSGFKKAERFNELDYQHYSEFMVEFTKEVKFDNLMKVDHFFNYIYWEYEIKGVRLD